VQTQEIADVFWSVVDKLYRFLTKINLITPNSSKELKQQVALLRRVESEAF
jgi:hypothetical protein